MLLANPLIEMASRTDLKEKRSLVVSAMFYSS